MGDGGCNGSGGYGGRRLWWPERVRAFLFPVRV